MMNVKTTSTIAALLLGSAVLLSACDGKKNDEPNIPADTQKVEYLNATAYDKWVYYSLKDNKVVETATPEKDLTWDIAFRRECIAVNAPEHYSGKGGIVRTKETNFGTSVNISALKFSQNVAHMLLAESPMVANNEKRPPKMAQMYLVYEQENKEVVGMDGKKVKKPVNKFLCYDTDMSKMMTGGAKSMYTPVKDLYIVRSADGKKMYRLQFTGAIDNKGKNGGTLSFRFAEITH